MGIRDSQYVLNGTFELDEVYFTYEDSTTDDDPLKRGLGSQRKAKVLVLVERACGASRAKQERPQVQVHQDESYSRPEVCDIQGYDRNLYRQGGICRDGQPSLPFRRRGGRGRLGQADDSREGRSKGTSVGTCGDSKRKVAVQGHV